MPALAQLTACLLRELTTLRLLAATWRGLIDRASTLGSPRCCMQLVLKTGILTFANWKFYFSEELEPKHLHMEQHNNGVWLHSKDLKLRQGSIRVCQSELKRFK